MNDILYSLCLHSIDIIDGWTPISARLIAKNVSVSLYKARKELRTLKENGYAYTEGNTKRHINQIYGAAITLRLLDLLLLNTDYILTKILNTISITKRLKMRSIGHIERSLS